jgi:hypothetical protein
MDRPAGGGAAIPLEGMAMKKILLALLVTLVGLLMMTPPAAAIPKEAKGCPADASVWTQVEFVTGDYTHFKDTSLYDYYWSLTTEDGEKVVDYWKATYGPEWTDEAIYAALAEGFDRGVDSNDDDSVCIWWIGEHYIGHKDLDMTYVSLIDNNANAH